MWDEEYCIIDEKFKSTVRESPGFQWLDEANPDAMVRKWGYIATAPEVPPPPPLPPLRAHSAQSF